MWPVVLVASLLISPLTFAIRPTTTTEGSSSCTRDEIYSSLSSEGREFCESLLGDHCATVSTPAAYTGLGDDDVSSYVRWLSICAE